MTLDAVMLVVCWLFQFSSVSSVLVILRLRSCQYVVGSCWVAYVRSSPLLPSPKRRLMAVPSGGRPPGLFSVYNLHCYAALLLQMAFLLRPCLFNVHAGLLFREDHDRMLR